MAYTIRNSRGTTVAEISDGSLNSNTGITLIGKNSSNYGEKLNENFYKLLENFASGTSPTGNVEGQLWFDTTAQTLKVRTSSNTFKQIGTTITSDTEPDGSPGDLWYDTSSSGVALSLYTETGGWQSVNQESVGESVTLTKTTGGTFQGIKFTPIQSGGANILVITETADSSSTLPEFTSYVSGLNVYGNVAADYFNGISDRATLIGNLTTTLDYNTLKTAVDQASAAAANVSQFSNITKIGTDGVGNIGQTDNRFNIVFAEASSARYADLAERFASDKFYDAGTLVRIGGEKEITEEKEELSSDVLGVISTNPAYLMNDDGGNNDTHPPVVIGGRAPVKVKGTIHKGQRLVSAGDGIARGASLEEITAFNVIGKSLENKNTDDISTVMAIIKINI